MLIMFPINAKNNYSIKQLGMQVLFYIITLIIEHFPENLN